MKVCVFAKKNRPMSLPAKQLVFSPMPLEQPSMILVGDAIRPTVS
jgi:hypothetical protein